MVRHLFKLDFQSLFEQVILIVRLNFHLNEIQKIMVNRLVLQFGYFNFQYHFFRILVSREQFLRLFHQKELAFYLNLLKINPKLVANSNELILGWIHFIKLLSIFSKNLQKYLELHLIFSPRFEFCQQILKPSFKHLHP